MKTYFTPGPAQLYPTFAWHLQRAMDEQVGSISHRSSRFRHIYQQTTEALRELLSVPASNQILFTGSATEVWERVLQNCVEAESFHLVNGAFSKKFYEFSGELGKRAVLHEVKFGAGFDLAHIPVPETAELICATHNETSSGVMMPETDIHALKRKNPDALLVVDMVSSAPYPALDYGVVDSAFFSVQKGFGMPAGLGVWIVNERCLQKAEMLESKGLITGTYHRLTSLWSKAITFETPATPNVLLVYLLGKIAEDMLAVGLNTIRGETEAKATRLYEAIERHPNLNVFVTHPAHRSQTVAVATTIGKASEIISRLSERGLVIGSGYGSYKDSQLRIANFPATTIEEVERLIEVLEEVA